MEPSDRPTADPPAAEGREPSILPLYGGFLLFGFTLGVTTGLSSVSGISQTLLTSLFTFVGGVVLSYAGFKRLSAQAETLDTERVGYGLIALTIGVLLGLYVGIFARLNPAAAVLNATAVAAGAAPASHAPTVRFELNSGTADICSVTRERLVQGLYSQETACAPATFDLQSLHDAACATAAGDDSGV